MELNFARKSNKGRTKVTKHEGIKTQTQSASYICIKSKSGKTFFSIILHKKTDRISNSFKLGGEHTRHELSITYDCWQNTGYQTQNSITIKSKKVGTITTFAKLDPLSSAHQCVVG